MDLTVVNIGVPRPPAESAGDSQRFLEEKPPQVIIVLTGKSSLETERKNNGLAIWKINGSFAMWSLSFCKIIK